MRLYKYAVFCWNYDKWIVVVGITSLHKATGLQSLCCYNGHWYHVKMVTDKKVARQKRRAGNKKIAERLKRPIYLNQKWRISLLYCHCELYYCHRCVTIQYWCWPGSTHPRTLLILFCFISKICTASSHKPARIETRDRNSGIGICLFIIFVFITFSQSASQIILIFIINPFWSHYRDSTQTNYKFIHIKQVKNWY